MITAIVLLKVRMLDALSDAYGFTWTGHSPTDGEWGRGFPNGSWTGLVGEVVHKRADVAVSMIAINTARWQVIEYTFPWDQNAHKIISAAPGPLAPYLTIAYPFEVNVWLVVFVTYLCLCISLTVIYLCYRQSMPFLTRLKVGSRRDVFGLWLAPFGSMLQEKFPSWFKHRSAAGILVLTVEIFALFIGTFYVTQLLANMLVVERSRAIET